MHPDCVATPEQREIIERSINREYTADRGPCPYCQKREDCEHWCGHGWTRTPVERCDSIGPHGKRCEQKKGHTGRCYASWMSK